MRKEEYFCNLCGEKTEKENLKTLYWKSDITPQRYVLLKDMWRESDKHICKKCITLIKETEK
jgi:hypothetical protein